MTQSVLRAWADAPAIVVSCPGPLRRHHAALTPVAQLRLPQCLLGGEAQLLAFVAAERALAPRMVFTPLPDLFATPESLAPLWRLMGGAPAPDRLPVHLRFGGVRSARVMKSAVNGHVLAEDNAGSPAAPSRHPFASGRVLPAAMRRLYLWTETAAPPTPIGRPELRADRVPDAYLSADLAAAPAEAAGRRMAPEIVSLAEFRSLAFATGALRGGSPTLRAARRSRDQAPFVLVPWNLDHPTSAVPAFIERLHSLRAGGGPALRPVLYPYNYPGQTGLIRRLARVLRHEAGDPVAAAAFGGAAGLADIFIARLGTLGGLPALRQLAPTAWVDAADPEAAWTTARLRAAGFTVAAQAAGTDEVVVTAESRYGLMHAPVTLPGAAALRALAEHARDASRPPRAASGATGSGAKPTRAGSGAKPARAETGAKRAGSGGTTPSAPGDNAPRRARRPRS